jgi:transcriptional/translational regulatory protein YebC/TACO1
MEGVVMRDIHPFTAPHNERAADSGNTATPMPLAIAAVSVAIDSISPMTFAVSRRREKASTTELEMIAQSEVELSPEDLEIFEGLVDALEDDDDVQKVYHNVANL